MTQHHRLGADLRAKIASGALKLPARLAPSTPAPAAHQLDPIGVDLYPQDVNGTPNLYSLSNAGLPWSFIILKVCQGLNPMFSSAANGWLQTYWKAARSTWGSRYGKTGFRAGYLYAMVGEDGRKQGEYFCKLIDLCGGWGDGDMWPVIDVEEAGQPANATNQQIIDCISACAERITELTGRMVMRYSGSYIRERAIVNAMGCKLLWVADWERNLNPHTYLDQGYALNVGVPGSFGPCVLWQGCGDGQGGWTANGYPDLAPIGYAGKNVPCDISAGIVNGGGDPNAVLAWIASHLGSQAV